MGRLRAKPNGAFASFGLSALVFVLMPTQVGFQDLAALIAQQPAVSARWRESMVTSPFGTIHAATFRFPRPPGTAIPEPAGYSLASLDPRGLDFTYSLPERPLIDPEMLPPPMNFPRVNRKLKGDALVPPSRMKTPREPAQAPTPASREKMLPDTPPKTADELKPGAPEAPPKDRAQTDQAAALSSTTQADLQMPEYEPADMITPPQDRLRPKYTDLLSAEHDTPTKAEPFVDKDLSLALKKRRPLPTLDPYELSESDRAVPDDAGVPSISASKTPHAAKLYFGFDAVNPNAGVMKQWEPGEAPKLAMRTEVDPDIKQSALQPGAMATDNDNVTKSSRDNSGQTVAPKGEVTGKDKRPYSPAERLKLAGSARAKAEKCLAEAIYFEARGESLRGQMAVAQVVINRVFTEHYPKTVCGVVYQNAHRKLACQFTFACDNVPEVIREPDMWAQAKTIAKDTLDGKIWLPEIGKATHYHAYWVRPWWVRTMNKLNKIGVHTFYRPRRWGDGSDIPKWGKNTTADEMKHIAEQAKKAKL